MAKLADSVMVCMGGGEWHVWGPSKRFPAQEDVEAAEAVLRSLWRDRVAVPAYNYGSWQGCKEYVPWCQWRAERRPTLDSPCFTTDYAEMDRRIYAKAGKDEDEQEEDDDAQVRQVRDSRQERPALHPHERVVRVLLPRVRFQGHPAPAGPRPRGGLL